MKNEDKIVTLLESMQGRMDIMQGTMESMQGDIKDLKVGQTNLEVRMDKLEIRIENEAFNKISILSEGLTAMAERQATTDANIKFLVKNIDYIAVKVDQNTEVLNDHTTRLERIEDKIATHDIKIKILDETKSNKRKAK